MELVNNAISLMADAAAACRKGTLLKPQQCRRSSGAGLANLRSAYDNAVTAHPSWALPGRTVLWVDPRSKHSLAVNFSAVARLLDMCGVK